MQKYRLQAPTGAEIIGTEETVSAVAFIQNVRPDGKGGFDYEHSGETQIDHENLQNVVSQGEVVYRDDHGSLWLQRELVLVPISGSGGSESGRAQESSAVRSR